MPAAAPMTNLKPFSIANFRMMFSQSRARQYMSDMEIEQIRVAVEEKDVILLGKLYEILLQEQATDEQIVREFVMTKNKIMDGFMVDAMDAEKKIVESPRKKKVAKAEKKEQKQAEAILKKLK